MSTPGPPSTRAGEARTGREADPLLAAVLAPLRDLLHRYDAAVAVMVEVRAGIEGILSMREPAPLPSPPSSLPASLRVEVGAASADAILAFTEGLASLPGVQHVTVAGATGARTNFLVELLHPEAPTPAIDETGGPPTIVCVHCLRVLVEGGDTVSHGLCPDCLEPFVAQAAMHPERIGEGRPFGQR
jgi:hypothetical protein